jgi:hypothetical protein
MKSRSSFWLVLVSVLSTAAILLSGLSLVPALGRSVIPEPALAEDLPSDEASSGNTIEPAASLHTLSIPMAGFTPENSTLPYGVTGDRLFNRNSAGYEGFWAPVHLPQGAVVVKLIAWGDTSVQAKYFGASIWRSKLSILGGSNNMAKVASSGQVVFEKVATSTIETPTVNNDSYSYFVGCHIDNGIVLHAIKIVYYY